MAKITGILPPSAVFIFALHRPPHISRPLAEGSVSFSVGFPPRHPRCHHGKLGEREGEQAEDPAAPSLSCYGDSLESVP